MKIASVALLMAVTSSVAGAADFSDADWPCLQRKVGDLSPGLMWSTPVTRTPLPPEAADLAALLALRRVSLEEAGKQVQAFVEKTPTADSRLLGNIFYDVFDRLSSDRQRLITGIARYSRNQIELSRKIDANRREMAKLTTENSQDFDRMDKLEEQIDWDERIYKDRAQALIYVCETPVILEKRVYAIARILMKYSRN